MVAVRRSRSRRGLVAAAVVGVMLATLVPTTAGALSPPPGARPAVVANPGPLTVTVTGGTLSLGGLEVALPECGPEGGRCLSMVADLGADGTLRVRPGSLQLPAIDAALEDLGLDLPVGLRIEAYTVGGIGGVLLPEAGLTRLDLGIGVRVVPDLSALSSGPLLGLLGGSGLSCGVGPMRLSLTTGSSGGLTGVPYDPATGTLTLVDGAYVVPPVTCSPLLLTVLQLVLGGSGNLLPGLDLRAILGDLRGVLGDLDLGSLGVDLDDLDLGDLDRLSAQSLPELLATVNAALGLPSAPGASGTSLRVSVARSSDGGAIVGGGGRWPDLTFADVVRGGEVERAVRWLAANAITNGVGGDLTRFAPERQITRGEMAMFIWRLMEKVGAPAECGFTDVNPSAFYAAAVCWMRAEGITVGTNPAGTKFSPNAPVTRSQMARFLWRLAGEPDVPTPANFDDVTSSAGFAAAVDWLRAHGITQGLLGTNAFDPTGVVTRSQMARFLHRLASRAEAWSEDIALPGSIEPEERCLALHC